MPNPRNIRVTKELIVGHRLGIDRVRVVMTGKAAEQFCVQLVQHVDRMKKGKRDSTIVVDIDGLLKAAC